MRNPRFAEKLVFVEDYDINVGRHFVQGVDVWLNNPRRPLEASGTSGQKVVLNGGLNLSVLDGWWAEAYDGLNGFCIGTGRTHSSIDIHDRRDAEDLYRVLREEVIPLYYERDHDGLPRGLDQTHEANYPGARLALQRGPHAYGLHAQMLCSGRRGGVALNECLEAVLHLTSRGFSPEGSLASQRTQNAMDLLGVRSA